MKKFDNKTENVLEKLEKIESNQQLTNVRLDNLENNQQVTHCFFLLYMWHL